MSEDAELLRRYANEHAEDAFAELVRRHVDLVYALALRQVNGDAHLAEDVTQVVFTALARKAAQLVERPVLGGWLYRTTQYAAIDVVRGEVRRRAREQEAHLMHELPAEISEAEWQKLRPLLDRAIGELDDEDRDAVVLRFFNGCSFATVGAKLRLSENAARMRVQRALDKLHAGLSRHGITSTTAALALALANQPGVAAPAGLATTVSGVALTAAAVGGAVGSGAVALGPWGGLATAKLALGALAAVSVLGAGAFLYEARENTRRAAALDAATRNNAALQAEVQSLRQRLVVAEQRSAAAEEDSGRLLAAIQASTTASAAEAATTDQEPITHESVQARYRHAQELAKAGQGEAALKEFLWCFDKGMTRITSYRGVRFSFLLGDINRLGEQYPQAIAALRERRDAAEKRVHAGASDFDALQTFASINRVLNEPQRTLAFLDEVKPGDPRRRMLAMLAFEPLVEARRYAEALEGRSYAQMNLRMEMSSQLSPDAATNPALQEANRRYVVSTAAKDIEVLVGAGDLDNARLLARRLLSYDATDATKTLLAERLTRAGHSELLSTLVSSR